MIPVQCDQVGHQGYPISALCLRQDCTIKSSYCMRCVKLHRDCTDHLKFLDQIPEVMSQLKNLRNWFRDSFDQIKQLIAKLEIVVNQHFLPIDEYTESPNLTNLNRLGQMLKDTKPQEIQELEYLKQKICKDLDHFRDMLSYRHEQQSILQIVPVELSHEDKDQVEEYSREGYRLCCQFKFQESIECYDKALKIDKNYPNSQFLKGVSLYTLSKYQEAIDSFDQLIEIDSQYYNPYYYKGISLQAMNKHQEARKCFDEQIKLKPNIIDSYQRKGESLRKLFRLKDEEECYMEGLKHLPNHGDLKKWLSSVREEMNKKK